MSKRLIISEEEKRQILKKHGLVKEQTLDKITQLAKDIISFIWSMKIIPGPIDGAKLLYDIYQTGNPVESIKNFVRSKINAPGENWERIESDMESLGTDVEQFKNVIYGELKNKLSMN
jgi:hypothetical protein